MPDGRSVITSQTIDRFAPSPAAAARAIAEFRAAGFEVGPLVGNSFSITGPVRTFETVFGTRLRHSQDGGVQAVTFGRSASPRTARPENLARPLGESSPR